MKNKYQRGFTLIEILIVMGLIGAIAVMIMGPIQEKLEKSNVEKTKLILGQVQSALMLFQNDCSKIPSQLDYLKEEDPECKNWGPSPYLKELPKDGWNRPLIFETDGVTYTLKSFGKDGKEGGDKANRDLDASDL